MVVWLASPTGLQVKVRIEARRMAAGETGEKLLLVSAVADVVANVVHIREREHHEVVAVAVFTKRARGGGEGLLVVGFAVDDRGDAVLGVAPHAAPDFHHVAAGRIDDVTTALVHLVHEGRRRAERGDDHHVIRRQVVVVVSHRLPRQ